MSAMKIKKAFTIFVLFGLLTTPLFSSNEIIEKIELTGNTYFTKDAFFHLLGIKEGDPYDEAKIREEFKKLWDSGYFSDLYVESQDGEKGKIVTFRVKERPKIGSIEYEEVKGITRSAIEDHLKERGIEFKTNTPLDMKTIWKVEESIRELLGSKGYLDAEVSTEIKPITATTRSVHFKVKRGPKTKIRDIEFVGNEIFSDRKLKKAMEMTKEYHWWSFFSKKSLYHPAKYELDIGNVRDLFLNKGYLDVQIGSPIVEIKEEKKRKESKKEAAQKKKEKKEKKQQEKLKELNTEIKELERILDEDTGLSKNQKQRKKKKLSKLKKKVKKIEEKAIKRKEKEEDTRKWVYLTVPVTEGEPYMLGKVRIEGNTVFSDEHVRGRIVLKEGSVLNESFLKYAVEVITADYGEKGYIYASVNQQKIRKEGQVADVIIKIDEDEQYYIERIEFEGNHVTNDNVLRREMTLNEGSLCNQKKLNISAIRVNQLGYFALTEEPIIEPIPGENRVRIKVKGEERGRNEIQVGGGYSGLEGSFFAGSYSTKNFLGRGEIFALSLQVGGRSNLYQFQFIEPWFLGRPYTLGFNLYHRRIDYARNFRTTGRGGGLILGRRFGNFTKMNVRYDLQEVEDESFLGTLQETRISSMTPSLFYDKVNNPYRPSRGFLVGTRTEIAGGVLGGDVSFYRPKVEATFYPRVYRRTFFGIHGEAGYIDSFEESKISGLIDGVPRYMRFYLGGEYMGPRIYETRSISPIRLVDSNVALLDPDTGEPVLDDNGNIVFVKIPAFVGGNKYLLFQFEYVIPAAEPVDIVLFYDAGNAFDNDESFSLSDLRMSACIEVRFFIPMFQVPLRLIYGVPINDKPWDETNRFQFSIGSSF